jgi:hypothetical protein
VGKKRAKQPKRKPAPADPVRARIVEIVEHRPEALTVEQSS